jgi:inositol oxygenase
MEAIDAPSERTPEVTQPLGDLDEWETLLQARYPTPGPGAAGDGSPRAFRDYRAEARPSVKEFYRLNHRHQTLEFVLRRKEEYLPPRRRRMGVWEAA